MAHIRDGNVSAVELVDVDNVRGDDGCDCDVALVLMAVNMVMTRLGRHERARSSEKKGSGELHLSIFALEF